MALRPRDRKSSSRRSIHQTGKKVFISYSHAQADWVLTRLVPCLEAGGADVLLDRKRFEAGRALVWQMDATQDRAQIHVLVLSPEYLASANCLHEMRRAVAKDPSFRNGSVIPVKRVDCKLPVEIGELNPLYLDLRKDRSAAQWGLLLKACKADLGVAGPVWLKARDDIARFLGRNQSVNFVVKGNVKWRPLILDLSGNHVKDLGTVDLDSGDTVSRSGLVRQILKACGVNVEVPAEPHDLAALQEGIAARQVSRVALLHFDNVAVRNYGPDLFVALRHLVQSEERKLVLLAGSRSPIATLLTGNHPFSPIDFKTVELTGDET